MNIASLNSSLTTKNLCRLFGTNFVRRVGAKKDGTAPKTWQTLVNAHNGILLLKFGRAPKRLNEFSKAAQKLEKTIINEIEEEFPDNGLHYGAIRMVVATYSRLTELAVRLTSY